MSGFGWKRWLAATAVVLCGGVLHTAQAAPLTDDEAAALMLATGASDALDVVSRSVQQSIGSTTEGAAKDAQQAWLLDSMGKAFSAARLKLYLAEEIKQSISAEEADQLAKWYLSPLGKKFVALELKAASAQVGRPQGELLKLGTDELTRTSPLRLEMYRDLVKTTKQGEFIANLTIRIVTAMKVSTAKLVSNADHNILNNIVRQMEAGRKGMIDQADTFVFANAALVYKEVSDQEMRARVEFEHTPTEQKFREATMKSLDSAIVSGMMRMVETIANSRQVKRQ